MRAVVFIGILLGLSIQTEPVAQTSTEPAMVLSRHASPPLSRLCRIDLGDGGIEAISGFFGDDREPQALAVDPVNGDTIVAIDDLAGGAELLRLYIAGSRVVGQRALGNLPGPVTDLEFALEGDLFAAVRGARGGIYRMERNGGPALLLRSLDGASVLHSPHLSSIAWIVSGMVPEIEMIELSLGGTLQGPFSLTGLGGAEVTGIGDLPTGAPRQVLSDSLGRLHLFEFFTQLRQIDLQPPLPVGGSVAMRLRGNVVPLVLGGSAHPFIKSVDWVTGEVRNLVGPLPGDPVDFAIVPFAGPSIDRFGSICAQPGSGMMIFFSQPQLGNHTFRMATRGGAANAPAVLVLGLSEQRTLGFSLPYEIPGGPCSLLVSVDLLLPRITDMTGFAVGTIAIPAEPALAGVTFYAQWLQGMVPAIGASGALALHVDF